MFSLKTKISMAKAVLTKDSPFYIQFYISKHCNLQCKMCNIVEAMSEIKPFGADKIEKIAENLSRIGAGVILLTGGEPYLRPDIDKIVKALTSRGMNIRLQTNGFRTNRDKIMSCFRNGAKDISVSIDSLDEERFDYINSVPGSTKAALETVSFISRNFPRKNSLCAFGCVLSRYNIDEIEPLLDFATRIGWWLSLVPVHITTPDNPLDFRGYDEFFKFRKSDFPRVKRLIKRLKELKRKGYNLFDSDDYLDSIYTFVSTGKPSWRHKGVCDSPNLYFAIMPDGKFAPCCDHRFPKDVYVYDDDFPQVFRSRSFRNDVRKITKKCPGCNFGSYPEMTLSARSWSTMSERLRLQMKTKKTGLVPLSEAKLFEMVKAVKADYPQVYGKERRFPERNIKKWVRAPNIPERLWRRAQEKKKDKGNAKGR